MFALVISRSKIINLGICPQIDRGLDLHCLQYTFKFICPTQWCSGRVSAFGVGDLGFDPRPCHTKDLKNGSNGCPPWRSVLQGWHND